MAPVTRRAAKARVDEESINGASEAENETSFEEPIALRSKRKTTTGDADDENDDKERAKVAATPKHKRLEVRIRGDGPNAPTGTSVKTEIEVLIPSSAIKTPRVRSSPVPDSQETDGSDDGDDAANQAFEPLSASKQLEEEANQKLASRARKLAAGDEVTPAPKKVKSSRTSSGEKANRKSVPQLQSVESEPEDEATPRPKAAAKSTHVVFGDDDDVDKFVAAAAEKDKGAREANAGDEDEEEESDDEAPEAVSTATAAKETLKSARAAIDAAEKYAASTKRKRQERENLLKEQAEKRKRNRPTKRNTSEKEDSSEGEDEKEEQNTSKRRRRNETLPDLLPAEFLTDSSEDEDDETALKKMVQRPQKITFETAMQVLGVEGKGPRDEVVGSTRYRVLAEQSDARLAPKANKNSRRVKEDLLRRGRVGVVLNKKRGFFVR
ncbi:hypothetical protein HD806DRAFT_10368 [Xylariaceae sp. AK1471]|nr:hypothetical protein HD806DRAFT_10368 [Xylariaceae sp. AK1471]